MGLLDGKVILITGAGNGLGRAHALAAARAGAAVLVNDLGSARDGAGAAATAADQVVAEIQALGGEALADHHSVTDRAGCDGMVAAALARWGRLDAVVNNAGILRDTTFRKMDDAAWRAVLEVHLQGTYNVTRAALGALLERGGAIVNTTSYSGMIGNFGQSNYAAAKAGIYGFTRVLSLELQKYGVTANCLAPVAKTRMTDDIAMVDAEWTAEQVSPMVVFLCSDLARGVTGRVFGVQGQRIHLYEVKVNDGVEKPGAEPWTAEEIAAHLDAICSFEPPKPRDSAPPPPSGPLDAAFAGVPGAFLADKAGDFSATIHFSLKDSPGKTIQVADGRAWVEEGLSGVPSCTVKTDTETIVGIMTSTLDAQQAFLKGRISADNLSVLMKFAMYFRFEGGSKAATSAPARAPAAPSAAPVAPAAPVADRPRWPIGKRYDGGYAFVEPADLEAYAAATSDDHPAYFGPEAVAPPMFHVRLFKGLMFALATDPELDLDMLRLVHGEHDATFHRPLRAWDLVQLRGELLNVEEKSSGLLVTGRMLGLVDGQVAVEAKMAYFIRAMKREGAEEKRAAPEAAAPPPPSFTTAFRVAPDQSYRYAEVSLDRNPIHIDPETARAAGHPDVILHGLCTMAMAGRAVLAWLVPGGDPRFLKRLSVRFARPVFNGSTLTAKAWKMHGGARFQVEDERGQVVISNGVAEVRKNYTY